MAYFANSADGMDYEQRFCARCVHVEACPVWGLHLLWNSEQQTDATKAAALDELIPRAGVENAACRLFHAAKGAQRA